MHHDDRFAHPTFTIRRKIFTFLGASFHVFDPEGNTVFFSRQKAFRLKEDIRLFTDDTMSTELMRMKARQVLDFGVTFDVVETGSDELVGSIRRKGLKSIMRDEWLLFNPEGLEIGVIREDSAGLAALRRFIEAASLILPQKYHVEIGGRTVATYQQNFNPFVQKLMIDFSVDTDMALDPRLGLAAGVLLIAVEGRQ